MSLVSIPLGWAADVKNGAALYAKHCLSCHGSDGKGVMPGAPDFTRGRTLLRSDGELFDRLKKGRGAMPGYFGVLRDREMFDVIAYLRSFQ